jgi:hypothetical protein
MKNQKNITDRKQLKSFFQKGNLPDQNAFEKLIDSTFNKADDLLDINEDGMMIYPSENGKEKLLSFFENKDDADATWVMVIAKKPTLGISINKIVQSRQKDNSQVEKKEIPSLFIQKEEGKVGIGTNQPKEQLDVKGKIASEGRVGNYHKGELDADGEWHNVFNKKALQGCNAYEIMAYAEGKPEDGKYSLMHAIAVSTYGNSKPKISKTCAHHGNWWNKIDIRWESRPKRIDEKREIVKRKPFDIVRWWKNIVGLLEPKDTLNYNLQLRTKSNYGTGYKIIFKVSVLWGPEFTDLPNQPEIK